MFHFFYYSVTINGSKEKSRTVFSCFSAIKNNAAPSSSHFPKKINLLRNISMSVLINLHQ